MLRYFLVATLQIVALVQAEDSTAPEKRYNVLSIGSQSYNAIMTAQFLSYMESKAYLIAL